MSKKAFNSWDKEMATKEQLEQQVDLIEQMFKTVINQAQVAMHALRQLKLQINPEAQIGSQRTPRKREENEQS